MHYVTSLYHNAEYIVISLCSHLSLYDISACDTHNHEYSIIIILLTLFMFSLFTRLVSFL